MKKLADPVMATYAKEIGAEGIYEKINVAWRREPEGGGRFFPRADAKPRLRVITPKIERPPTISGQAPLPARIGAVVSETEPKWPKCLLCPPRRCGVEWRRPTQNCSNFCSPPASASSSFQSRCRSSHATRRWSRPTSGPRKWRASCSSGRSW